MAKVFVTGGTGFLGGPLIDRLAARGHGVRALVRPSSLSRLPRCAEPILGDVLSPGVCRGWIRPGDTVVHLVGVAHPAPFAERAFGELDAASLRAVLASAREAPAAQFVYVSVAHPAPVLRACQRIRTGCEQLIRESGLPQTFLRPRYVVGPGHWWPLGLAPFYHLAERLAPTRPAALRWGLLWRRELIEAMIGVVESRPEEERILDVSAIRGLAARVRAAASSSSPTQSDGAPAFVPRSSH